MSTDKQNRSPGLFKWILSKLVRKELLEEFLGDLEEMYEERALMKGAAYARLMYCVDAMHLLTGFASVRIFKERNISTMMYNHYILTAFRNLARTKVYSAISIVSLAVGMGVCLTICQYLFFEMSYDSSFKNSQSTYRLAIDNSKPGE